MDTYYTYTRRFLGGISTKYRLEITYGNNAATDQSAGPTTNFEWWEIDSTETVTAGLTDTTSLLAEKAVIDSASVNIVYTDDGAKVELTTHEAAGYLRSMAFSRIQVRQCL